MRNMWTRRSLAFVSALALSVAFPAAQTRAVKTLDIYVVDVEGGNATLFVSPSGESLLIDTGNAGAAAVRDAERIMAAVKDAGLAQIDHLITTHWHGDHFGGMAELAARVPIRNFIDHGPNVQPAAAADEFLQKTYPQLFAKAKHTVAKPGMKIPVAGLDVLVVTRPGRRSRQLSREPAGRIPTVRASSPERTTPRTRCRSGPHSRSESFGRFIWAI